EFGTTLFGAVPYLLIGLLAGKGLASFGGDARPGAMRFDRADGLLLAFYGSFFLLLELFPNGFALDAYYTVPRIFRYLAPLSFPIALHAAKLLLDFTAAWRVTAVAAVFFALLLLNLLDDAEATRPGRTYRTALHAVADTVNRMAPPQVVAESTVGYWLEALLLDPERVRTEVVTPDDVYAAEDCEAWLRARQATFPTGTLLVTGLTSYVHYGAHLEGFRLAWFGAPLDPRWELVGSYGVLSYRSRPEEARLWRLASGADAAPGDWFGEDVSSLAAITDPEQLFKEGMGRYERNDYPGARIYFRKLLRDHPATSEDAAFFYAATFFRESRWTRAEHEFKRLVARYPHGRWIAGAHWHIAMCEVRRGHIARGRARLAYVVRRFASDTGTAALAQEELRKIQHRRGGVVLELWRRLTT
ncbi:MAG: tetratricopeptide repeat protein, partial [Candidatus Binatia bacterium]